VDAYGRGTGIGGQMEGEVVDERVGRWDGRE